MNGVCYPPNVLGENQETATLLFKRAKKCIENHGPGVVKGCLVDGGKAIDRAVMSLENVTR